MLGLRRNDRPAARARSAAVAAVFAALVLVAACTDASPDDDAFSDTTSSTAGGAAGGPSGASARTLDGWARSTSEALHEGVPSATLTAVLAPQRKARWVIGGTVYNGDGVPRAAVWRSNDALEWTVKVIGGPRTEA